MLGRNRGRILHHRRKPKKVVVPVPVSGPMQELLLDTEAAASAWTVANRVGSELSLLRFADSVEPSMLWEILKCK